MSPTSSLDAGSSLRLSETAAPPGAGVADEVEEKVRQNPWVERLVRPGWYAKGAVYTLMGCLALQIALHRRPSDPASPEGALGVVAAQPAGRVLLSVLAVGLLLYAAWRVLSILVIRGWDPRKVLERIGYGFSAAFYAVLAFAAAGNALRGGQPDDSYTIERLSRSLLQHTPGRVVLLIGGLVVIAVGGYFAAKSLRREYVDHLRGVHPNWHENRGMARVVFVAGAIGWFGRGIVTAMVGFFVARAAVTFDPSDASGFDRTLRRVAESGPGAVLVATAGGFLLVYGAYCLLSASRREIAESSP